MVRSYSRVEARAVSALAAAALMTLCFWALLMQPAAALAYYGHPSLGDNYQRIATGRVAVGAPGSQMAPSGFTAGPDGRIWAVTNDVLGLGVSQLQDYTPGLDVKSAPVVRDFSGSGGTERDYTSLSGLALGPDGMFYTCCGSDGTILVIDPATGLVTNKIGDGTIFSSPTDLEFDRNGNLFVVDQYWDNGDGTYGRIVRYNSTFTSHAFFNGAGSADGPLFVPEGLSIDALNDIWVADSYNNRIVEFSNSGAQVLSVFRPQTPDGLGGYKDLVQTPQDVYVDGYGTMYVTDQAQLSNGSSRFVRIGSDGSFLGSFPSTSSLDTLNAPTKIAVNSMVYGGDVFLNDNLTPDTYGVAGAVERWKLYEINPDLTAPVTTSNAPSGWQLSAPVVVSLTATDTQSGVALTQYGYTPSTLTTYTAPISISAEGTTSLYFQSIDFAGNVETLNHTDILIDHTAPVTTSTIQSQYYGTPTASLGATDSASGLAATWWRVDGSAWATGTTPVLDQSFGTHTLDWYSVDIAGNRETTHTASYEVLTRAEQNDSRISLTSAWATSSDSSASGGSYAYTNHSGDKAVLTFRGTRLDVYSIKGPAYGIAKAKLDGGTAVNVDLYTSSKTYKQKVWTTGVVADATHTVEFSYSGTKNASATSATVNVDAFDTMGYVGQADVTPPSTSSNAPAGWARPPVNVTLSAIDDITGIDSTYYSSDGSMPTILYSAPIPISTEGTTTLRFYSVDRAGNIETVKNSAVRVDNTAPTTTSTVQPAYIGTATVLLAPTDTLSGVTQTWYSLDGAQIATGTSVTTSVVGTHTLAFRSVDAAGNSETTQTVTFDVTRAYDDNSAFIYYRGTWSHPSSGGAYGGTYASVDTTGTGAYLTFHGTRVDLSAPAGPGMGLAHVYVDGGDAGLADLYAASPSSQKRVFALGGLTDATHTVAFQWTGTKNAASTGTTVALDAVDVVSTLLSDSIKPTTASNIVGPWQQGHFNLVLTPADQGTWVTTTFASINGSTTVYSGPIDITADGTNTVKFWSVDAAGNVEATNTATVLVDPYAPVSADNIPTPWQRTPFTVSLNATDTESGVLKILYMVGGGQQILYGAPFVVSTEGTNDVMYYAVDNVGNAEGMHTAELRIDTSNPITTNNAPIGWVKGPIDVSLTATDAYSGLAQTVYGLNGAAPSLPATAPIHIAAEGTTTIAYRSTDIAGNVEATQNATVRVDNTAPHTTSNCAASYASTATVTLSPSDSLSGVASTVWRIDSGSWTTGTVTLPFVAGFHTLQWASTDVAGNVEATQSASYQMMQRWEQTDPRFYFKGGWTLDSNASHSGGSARAVNATQSALFFDFTGTRFDLISPTGPGFGKALITIDGTTTPATADLYSASPASHVGVYSNPGLPNTTHIVRIDWMGTKNAASTGTTISVDAADLIGQLNTDTVAPVTTSDASSAWRTTTATITLSASDVHSFVANSYYRTGSTTTTYTAPFTVSAEGTTAVQFWSVDAAGNVESTNSVNVRIDRTAPVTSDDSTSTWQKGPVTVHLTSTDAGCGVATLYYSLDGSNPSLVTTSGAVTISAEGTTTLKYRAVDALGNSESAKTATIKIDNTAPGTANNASAGWVKSPASVSLTASDSLSGVYRTYYSIDGSNPSLTASGPVSISGDGTTTLKYYSRDIAGNSETTKSVAVKVDAVAPVTTATVQPEYMTSATIVLVPTDTESGVATTYWRIDGSNWSTGSVASTTTGGTHQLDYYSVDGVGNIEGVHSASFDVAIRYESGSSYIAKWPSSYWYSQANSSYSGGAERYTSYHNGYSQFVFNGTGFHLVASKASGYGTGTVTVDGASTTTVDFSATSTAYQVRMVNVTGLPNTQHVVRLTCTNALGRSVRFDAVDIVGVLNTQADVTPPTTTDNTDGLWHKGGFDVALSANDSLSSIAGTYYTLNGGAQQSYVGTFTISTEGTNTLQYYSVDSAANQEDTNTANVLVDSSAPITSDDATSAWQTSPVTVHISAADAYSGVAGTHYSVNGSAAATYTTGIGVAAEGTTTIAYASIDNVGNAESTKTATVRLDFTAPVTSSNATSSYANTATITLAAADTGGSGVANTSYSLDGSALTSGTVISTTAVGSHTLAFRSIDTVGHIETTKTVVFTIVSRTEQDSPTLLWRGTWSNGANVSHSGGSWKYASTSGALCYVYFTGTKIDVIGAKGPNYGQALISVDGSPSATVDYYSSAYLFQQKEVSFNGLAAGPHTLSIAWLPSKNASSTGTFVGVDALDTDGAVATDTVAPITACSATGAWRSSPETVTLTPSDVGSWVASTRFSLDGAATTTYTAPFSISTDGAHTIAFASTDGAGNVEATKTAQVRIDRVAPVTTDNASSGWVSGPLSFSLTATDALSGVASTVYSLDGSAPSIPATSPIVVSAEGTSTLRYASTDNAGNIESANSRTLRVDSSAPVSADDAPAGWVATPTTVHLSATDLYSGVAGIRYTVDGSDVATYTTGIPVSSAGTHTIVYSAVDCVGNIETSHTALVRIDWAAPTTIDDAPSGWTGGPVLVTLTATDDASGVSATLYSLDGTTPTVPYTSPVVVTAQGATSLRYYSVDVRGNAEPLHSTTLLIDNGAPVTTDNAPGAWVHGPVSVTLTATDAVSGVSGTQCSINGGAASTYNTPLTVSDEGTTTLAYTSTDVKGNVEPTRTATIRIDNTAPVTASNAQAAYNGTATITLSPVDTLSGIAVTQWSLDGSVVNTGTVVTVPVGGRHTLTWASTDAAGNAETTNSASFDVTNRLDDADLSFNWRGTWSTALNNSMYLNAQHWTGTNGSAVYLNFIGSGVTLVGSKGPDCGIAAVSVDGSTSVDVDLYSSATPFQQRLFTIGNLPIGPHSVSFVYTGRKNPSSASYKIDLDAADITGVTATDTTPPSTDASLPAGWSKTPVTVGLNGSDANTWVAATFYALNGGALTTYTAPFVVSTEGTTALAYRSVDGVGNQEATKTALVRVDLGAPSTSSDATSAWSALPATIHLTPSDAYSGVASTWYALNGTPSQQYSADGITIASDGTSTVTFASADNAGNVESTKTATVRLDFTAPVTSSNATSSYLSSATINLTASDTGGSGVINTSYSLDGAALTSGTAVSTAATGTHTLAYRSTDAVGHVEATKTATFIVLKRTEQDSPKLLWRGTWSTASNASHSGGSWKYASTSGAICYAAFTGTRIDLIGAKGPNYGQALIAVDGGVPTTLDYYSGGYLFAQRLFSVSGLPQGNHSLTVTWTSSKNASSTGNFIGVDAFDTDGPIVADTVAPVTSTSAMGLWRSTPETVTLTPTDIGSWVASTRYSIDGGATTTYTVPFSVLADGAHSIAFSSTDGAANVEATKTAYVRIDRVAPSTSSNAPSGWAQGPLSVSLVASDALSGVAQTLYSLDGSAPSLVASGAISVNSEGTSTLRYASTDNAGNSEIPTTKTLHIDSTAPVTTDDAPSGWIGGPTTVHLVATDSLSGVAGIRYDLDGAAVATYTTGIQVTTSGVHTLDYAAVDAVGNFETTHTVHVSIDAAPPTTSAHVPAGWTGGPVLASLSATDDVSGVAATYYSTDGITSQLYTGPFAITAQGVTAVSFSSVDLKGNVEPTQTVQVMIDDFAPTTTGDAPSGWAISPRFVHLTATDAASGVSQTLYSLDNSTPTVAYPPTGIPLSSEGTVTLRYQSVDVRGNLESVHSATFFLDAAAPSTIASLTQSGNGTATVSLVASDALSGLGYTEFNLDSTGWSHGTSITVAAGGSHTLLYRSVDVAGNVEPAHALSFDIMRRTEQTDPSITWRGTWTNANSLNHSGGSWKYTSSAGTWAYEVFDGTRIDLYGAKGPNYGQVRLRVDNGSPTTVDYYSASVFFQQKLASFANLPNGRHVLSIEYLASHNASATSPYFVGVDAFDLIGVPVGDTLSPVTAASATGAWRTTAETVSLTPTDTYTWVAATRYSVDGSATTTYTIPFTLSAEGTHTILYSSTDGAGNNESTKTAFVRIDHSLPWTTDDAPTAWTNGPVTLHLWPNDAVSGVSATAYSTDGSTPTVPYATPIMLSAEGTTTLKYDSTDLACNVETAHSVNVRIDNTPPNASDDATAGWVVGPAVVHLTATDPLSGVSATTYSVDGSGTTTYTAGVSIATEGTHSIAFSATDKAHNTSALTATVRVDSTPPVTTATVSASYVGTAAIPLAATDSLSGVAHTEYRLDGGAWSQGTTVTVTDGGQHTLDYRSVDNAGNTESYSSATFDVIVRYEQTDPLLDFEGTWTNKADAQHSAGSYLYSVTAGSALNVAFTGKSIDWITLAGPTNGIAHLTLDGTQTADIDLYSAALQYRKKVWSSGVLSDTRHTLRIEYTGSKNASSTGKFVGIDAFDVDGTLQTRRYEQTDTLMNFASTWADKTDVNMSSGSYKYTQTTGSALNVAFTGSRIDWITMLGPSNGIARVTLDGSQTVDVDLYSPNYQYKATAWSSGTLSKGFHTLRIECLGTKNTASSGKFMGVDAIDVVGLLSERRYEQTDVSLDFAGAWSSGSDPNMSGGSYKYTQTTGSVFNATFSGTSVAWITSRGTVNGIAAVSLDGGATQTVDLYASSYQTKQTVWSSGYIADGVHTLRIAYTGSKNASSTGTAIGVDAIDIVGITQLRRCDDADPLLAYEGAWTKYTDANMSGGSYVYSHTPGAALNVAFTGDRFDWITSVGNTNGIAKVTLDGTQTALVDLYSPTFKYKQVVWSTGTIADGAHTLRIEYTGSKNASSADTFIGVDGFDIYGALTQAVTGPLPVTVEESNPNVSLVGTWTAGTDSKMSGGTYAFSNSASSTASLSFTGTQVDWIGPTGSNYGLASVSIDGGSPMTVDLYSPTYVGSATIWTSGALAPGQHTLTVTVLGAHGSSSSNTYVSLDDFVVKGTVP